jgi:hypothetical protein
MQTGGRRANAKAASDLFAARQNVKTRSAPVDGDGRREDVAGWLADDEALARAELASRAKWARCDDGRLRCWAHAML